MRPRTRALACAAALALTMTTGTGAVAQTSLDGALGPDHVRATAQDLGAGTFPGAGLPSAQPASVSAYQWERTATAGRCVVFGGPIPPALVPTVTPLPGIAIFPFAPLQVGALQGAPPDAVRLDGAGALAGRSDGRGRLRRRHRDATATVGPACSWCPGARSPGRRSRPAPPTAAEIWQQTPLPRATVHASPPGTREWPGIVNLESWFWSAPLADAACRRRARRLPGRRRGPPGRVRLGVR